MKTGYLTDLTRHGKVWHIKYHNGAEEPRLCVGGHAAGNKEKTMYVRWTKAYPHNAETVDSTTTTHPILYRELKMYGFVELLKAWIYEYDLNNQTD